MTTMEEVMGVEAVDLPTAAELELERSLEKLREQIARVPQDAQIILLSLQASLGALDRALSSKDSRGFVEALVELARGILEVRQAAGIERDKAGSASYFALLAQLPVPPYDLWLPFKAGSLRSSDEPSSRYSAAAPVHNRKIGGEVSSLLELLGHFLPDEAFQKVAEGKKEDEPSN